MGPGSPPLMPSVGRSPTEILSWQGVRHPDDRAKVATGTGATELTRTMTWVVHGHRTLLHPAVGSTLGKLLDLGPPPGRHARRVIMEVLVESSAGQDAHQAGVVACVRRPGEAWRRSRRGAHVWDHDAGTPATGGLADHRAGDARGDGEHRGVIADVQPLPVESEQSGSTAPLSTQVRYDGSSASSRRTSASQSSCPKGSPLYHVQ